MSRRAVVSLAVIITVYLIYASVFMQRMTYDIGGHKYYMLMEDAMISMTYARNLAAGHGMVWNAGGERIEGITNPLWTVYMAIPHLLKIKPENTSLFIQITAALLLALNILFVFRLGMLFMKDEGASLLAAGLTGFYFPLNAWSLMGMEVSAITLLMTVSVWLAVRALEEKRFEPWVFVICGILPLIRIDQALFGVVMVSYIFFADPQNRRRTFIWGASALFISLAGQTVFRALYYHDILPNTYYLKMTGYPLMLRMARGLFTVIKNSVYSGLIAIPLAAAGFIVKKGKYAWLFLTLVLSEVTYSIYVGGDITEHFGGANRFYSIAMPYFFLLCSAGTRFVTDSLKTGKAARNAAFAAVGLLVLLSVNSFLGPKSLKEFLLINPMKAEKGILESVLRRALIIREITGENATIAVVTAGIPSYFNERTFIDLLGKADRHIAKMGMHLPDKAMGPLQKAVFFAPGHLKWDYEYSIEGKRPDVIAGLWWGADSIEAYLKDNYVPISMGMYVLKKSPNIIWDKIPNFSAN